VDDLDDVIALDMDDASERLPLLTVAEARAAVTLLGRLCEREEDHVVRVWAAELQGRLLRRIPSA
jgi:hypothetical protein